MVTLLALFAALMIAGNATASAALWRRGAQPAGRHRAGIAPGTLAQRTQPNPLPVPQPSPPWPSKGVLVSAVTA
jgi:hypothetical protein